MPCSALREGMRAFEELPERWGLLYERRSLLAEARPGRVTGRARPCCSESPTPSASGPAASLFPHIQAVLDELAAGPKPNSAQRCRPPARPAG